MFNYINDFYDTHATKFLFIIILVAFIFFGYDRLESNRKINRLYNILENLHVKGEIGLAALYKNMGLRGNEVIFYINNADFQKEVQSFIFSKEVLSKRGYPFQINYHTSKGELVIGFTVKPSEENMVNITKLIDNLDESSLKYIFNIIRGEDEIFSKNTQ